MLTKGIIQSIDMTGNTCVVRLPLFETAGNKSAFTATAILSNPPGVYNGYRTGDVVVVGFGSGGYGDGVVIGKLYLGATQEKATEGGSVHCSDFVASNSVSLPATVRLGFADGGDATMVKTGDVRKISSFDSLKTLAEAVAQNEADIAELQEKTTSFSSLDEACGTWIDGKTLYKRTTVVNRPEAEGETIDSFQATAMPALYCWVDAGHSFVLKKDGGTRQLTGCETSAVASNSATVSGLALTSGETAYITLIYVSSE